jgi:hypothetical protein
MAKAIYLRDAAARFRFRVRAAFFVFLLALYYVLSRAPTPSPRRAGSALLSASGAAVAARAAAAVAGPKPRLLSEGKRATSDVRGNLADASVVTLGRPPGDWLTDRWQAASDMVGTPIPGEHWVEVDLGEAHELTRFVIIWEKAFATKYQVRGRLYEDAGWADLAAGRDAASPHRDEKHVVHVLDATKTQCGGASCLVRARFVRLVISEPATQWGASVWRFEVYGK